MLVGGLWVVPFPLESVTRVREKAHC